MFANINPHTLFWVFEPSVKHELRVCVCLSSSCIKCKRACEVDNSCKAGANPLRRICWACGATDKGLNRAAKGEEPKKTKGQKAIEFDPSAVVTVSQEEARRIVESLKKMTEQEKTVWYLNEIEKRESEDKLSRRTFSQPKGYVDQKHQTGSVKDEKDDYEVFDDFALRMIQLKRCEDEAGAATLWTAALQSAGATVIERRGQKCLGRFKGVSVAKREADLTESGTKQTQELSSSAHVDDFLQQAVVTHERAEKKAYTLTQTT